MECILKEVKMKLKETEERLKILTLENSELKLKLEKLTDMICMIVEETTTSL